MVDDDRLRWHQERVQSLWNLRELHPLRLKDLQGGREKGEKKKSPKKVAKVASGQSKMLSDSASKASGIKCIEYVLNIQSRPLSSVVLGRSR